MSRTIKHRNKDGSRNDFIKSLMGNPAILDVESCERTAKYYQRKNISLGIAKEDRQEINNRSRNQDKQRLAYALATDKLDDQPTFKWTKRTTGYRY